MAHTPPIDRKALRGSEILSEDRFFQILTENCNYIDKATARDFYMGLVKTVSQELRNNGMCRLPHLGDMALVKMKPRSVLTGKIRQVIEGVYTLKFYPKDSFREYFTRFQATAARLDPRERILHKNI